MNTKLLKRLVLLAMLSATASSCLYGQAYGARRGYYRGGYYRAPAYYAYRHW